MNKKKCEHKNWIPAGEPIKDPFFGDGVLRITSLYEVYCLDCNKYVNLLTRKVIKNKKMGRGINMNLEGIDLLMKVVPQTYGEAIRLYPGMSGETHEWDNRTTMENAVWLIDYLSSTRKSIIPERLARSIISLDLPLTEEKWYGLMKIFEKLQPGITACFSVRKEE